MRAYFTIIYAANNDFWAGFTLQISGLDYVTGFFCTMTLLKCYIKSDFGTWIQYMRHHKLVS